MVDLGKILTSPQLPTIPAVAIGLLQLARDPDADVQGVIRLVKTDPAISAKLLKSANSSFFAIKSPVNSVERAIPLLGSKVVTSLALSFSLVDAAMKSGPLAGHYQAYWKQSIVQAAAAEVLAEDQLPGLTSECFLAGLLLDLGRLAMLKTVAMEYLPVLAQWEREGGPLHEIEGRVLGTDHIAVSVELSRTWKLPAVLVEAASLHHAPVDRLLAELQRTGSASNEIAVQGVAAVAAAAGDFYCSKSKGYFWDRLRQLTEKLNGYTEPALERFLERTRARIDRAGNLFEVHFDELGTPADLMAQAGEQLAQVAVREHLASNRMRIQRDVVEQENKELESKNRDLALRALRDPLTGLYNRTLFAKALETAIHAAARAAKPIGMIFSDIDHFKRLNDTYGHPFGDQVLNGVARIFTDVVRKSDVVARYGGEEFVVLVPEPTESGLMELSERLRQSVESASFAFEGTPVSTTVSIGAVLAVPPRRPEDLAKKIIAAADEAMYEAKHNGRNQVRMRSLVTTAIYV